MKNLILGLVTFSISVVSGASADVLGTGDDTYVGLQVTIPLESKSAGLLAKSNRYSLMLLEQSDGIRDGVAYTLHGSGSQAFSYIKPTVDFKIGRSRLADYSLPLIVNTSGIEGAPAQRLFPELGDPWFWLVAIAFLGTTIVKTVDDVIGDGSDSSDDDADVSNEISELTQAVDQVSDDLDQVSGDLNQVLNEIETAVSDQLNGGG